MHPFQALIDEESSNKLTWILRVVFVFPYSCVCAEQNDYGGGYQLMGIQLRYFHKYNDISLQNVNAHGSQELQSTHTRKNNTWIYLGSPNICTWVIEREETSYSQEVDWSTLDLSYDDNSGIPYHFQVGMNNSKNGF